MRNSKQLDLKGAVGKLTVSELRVGEIRKLIGYVKSPDDLDVLALLSGDDEVIAAIIDSCLAFEDGRSTDDLSVSEVMQVAEKFQEVNQPFFDLIKKLGLGLNLQLGLGASLPETSTEAAPS